MYCKHCGREVIGAILDGHFVAWVHMNPSDTHCNWPHDLTIAMPALDIPLTLRPVA